jgi:biotin-dependent carboxylase-like uncharacterized protein
VIEVLDAGLLTSVQTAGGRPGYRHLGVPVGGAADAWSARLANRLLGNRDDAPLLEITVTGPTLRFTEPTWVAFAGADLDAALDGLAVPALAARRVRAGATLRIGSGRGARAYLAIAGGLAVVAVLGSAATDLRSGFGGLDGRALRPGDRLAHGPPSGTGRRWTGARPDGPIRVVDGPHAANAPDWIGAAWRVGQAADRTGVRLDGPALALPAHEVPSMGLPLGAMQVPPDGHPIVMLADRPVTGGYAVPLCVILADVGRVAQLLPGEEVRLARVTKEAARAADADAERELDRLEPQREDGEDAIGWTGAHG